MSLESAGSVLITFAFVFYTIAVFSERRARLLKPWHLIFFWLGLMFDASGTWAMGEMSGGWDWSSWHAWTGAAAFILMAIHTLWASVVVVRRDERWLQVFHHYSLAVWLFWLVPFLGGMFAGMFGREL